MPLKYEQDDPSTARGCGKTPHVSIDFTIELVGYQMDLYVNGKLAEIECRDFGGAPPRKKSSERLIHFINDAVEKWRQSL